jgi:hypothetical protein
MAGHGLDPVRLLAQGASGPDHTVQELTAFIYTSPRWILTRECGPWRLQEGPSLRVVKDERPEVFRGDARGERHRVGPRAIEVRDRVLRAMPTLCIAIAGVIAPCG